MKRYKIKRCITVILGALLLVNALTVTLVSNMHAGIAATWALGVIFLLCGSFYKRIPAFIKCMLYIGTALAAAALAFLFIYGRADNVSFSEDAVIVLGAGIRGEVPSKSLAARLDAAAEYYFDNPDALIVVSGGQGKDEAITEALAMERYLVAKGVPRASIVKEERSTSTAENFEFSKEMLEKIFDGEYRIAFSTSDYHIFRAGLIAKDAGIDDAAHIGAPAPWYTVIPSGLRECMAIVRFYLPC